jgi:hypothetical protein
MSQHPPEQKQIDILGYCKYISTAITIIGLSNPIELIKTRMQTSPEHINQGTISKPYLLLSETASRIMKEEGFKGFWKGTSYFIMRTIPSNIGVFTLKELIHRKLNKFVRHGEDHNTTRQFVENHFVIMNTAIGGLAGLTIQILIYPFDYLRIIVSS